MSAIDDALEAALCRQRAKELAPKPAHQDAHMSDVKKTTAVAKGKEKPVDPFSPEAILRAANEDDDLYDPYSDYMDALARSNYEEPEEDPWR